MIFVQNKILKKITFPLNQQLSAERVYYDQSMGYYSLIFIIQLMLLVMITKKTLSPMIFVKNKILKKLNFEK